MKRILIVLLFTVFLIVQYVTKTTNFVCVGLCCFFIVVSFKKIWL